MTLKAEEVAAGYGVAPVLKEISVALQQGEFVGLIGPNGCGKSTLLRVLSGVLKPQKGRVMLQGKPLQSYSALHRARQIAFVPQTEASAFEFTSLQIALMGRHPHSAGRALSAADYAFARQSLALADVEALENRAVTTLSGGEHRRVLLARGLAQDAPLLLLDEPAAHLDITHQIELMLLLQRLAKRSEKPMGVLAALHDLNQAAEFCDRLVLMCRGEVAAEGTPEQVLVASQLDRVYQADTQVGINPASGKPMLLSLHPRSELAQLPGAPRVHLVCGGGSGAEWMGRLTRAGFYVSVGALNRLDTDEAAASALGLETALEEPYSAYSPRVMEEARALMQRAQLVVLAAVPFGYGNLANLELVWEALQQGKTVWMAGGERYESRDFTGGSAAQILKRLAAEGAQTVENPDEWVARGIEALNRQT